MGLKAGVRVPQRPQEGRSIAGGAARAARKRSIIFGAGPSGRMLAREIVRSRNGYDAVGFVDDAFEPGHRVEGLPVLGCFNELEGVIRTCQADTVIIAEKGPLGNSLLADRLALSRSAGVRVVDMATVFETLTGKVPVEHVESSWFHGGPAGIGRSQSYALWKRAGDILLSVVALAAFAVALPAAALAIKLDSRGPVFFRQTRIGFRGRVFHLYKLRTMSADAEADGNPVWAEAGDPRVTRIGKRLRKYRFDELPQFWNVLRGEMTVVGPRPERPFFVERLRRQLPHYDLRHELKPGVTGWAQICQGYASSCQESHEKLQFDLYYLRHRSLVWDLAIVFKTVKVVLFGYGAK